MNLEKLSISEINNLIEYYWFRNKTDLVNHLLSQHYNHLLKWDYSLDLWNSIQDDLMIRASLLLKKFNPVKYSYYTIIQGYYKKYWEKISENTLLKLKTKHKDSLVKSDTVYKIIKLLENS